ncbi:MAG TPA: molybdenum cofactor guanylyltransferase [Gemmatimonadaceae bacterium]|jgi:molybdopterin-guanine dinucleotide biosynthesis protein A|nr:molybdenum cofactor guanylyltransferase [Gemmatimonadaceae bacterium]
MSTERCVGALMAGGAARRFHGMPKGLAIVDGMRIADRALAALRGASSRQIVVANDPRAPAWFAGVRIVPDAEPGLGPLAGLCTALRAAEGNGLLVVAWDMPYVTSALLAALRDLGESGASAVIPMTDRRPFPEPLCAYYGPAALPICEQLLAQGERRAIALFEAMDGTATLRGAELDALGDPMRLLRSVDTPEELAAIGGRLPEGEDAARR